jgi:hypothetical protein
MFGFGKKKKVREQFVAMINAVLGTYVIMRSLSKHRMEETKLKPLPLQMFEASYILGVIDAISHGIDPDEEVLNQDDLIDACENACVGMEIFDKAEVGGIFSGAMMFQREGNAMHKLMYLGGTDAQACLNAMMDGKDSSESAKAMGLNYLDDKELVENFKKLLSESGIN